MSTATATKTESILKFMDTYCVVLFDDDVTEIEVVMDVLINVLEYSESNAFEVVFEIQDEGKAVVKNRLTKDEAEKIKSKMLDYASKVSSDVNLEILVAKEM